MSNSSEYDIYEDVFISVYFADINTNLGLVGLSPTIFIINPDGTDATPASNTLTASSAISIFDGFYEITIPYTSFSQLGRFQYKIVPNNVNAEPNIIPGSFNRVSSLSTLSPITSSQYASLTDVKRLLRALPDGNVDFSENVRDFNSSVSGFYLSQIAVSDDFAGKNQNVKLTFSDSTSFSAILYKTSTGRNPVQLGSGNVLSTFNATGGYFTILPAYWTGSGSISGTEVSFILDSDISNNDGKRFIEDAEEYIDARIQELLLDEISINEVKLFPTSVPRIIKFAATRLAAYFIYSSINNMNMTTKEKSGEVNNEVSNWYKQAERLISGYINYKLLRKESAPRIIGHEPIFIRVGVDGVGKNILDEINFDNDKLQILIDNVSTDRDEYDTDVTKIGPWNNY